MTRTWGYRASERADDAIAELNARFQEHGVGYAFEDGEIIRVDSQLLHAEAVKPALILLGAPEYAGAQAEFLTAHEHYRHGRDKEALAECLKALESVMKAICAKRNWAHDPNAPAKALIEVLFDKGLVPTFWNGHFHALRSTLEAGVPTARNRLGGHGQGTEVVQVPKYLVAYVLHMTASAVVFLAEAEGFAVNSAAFQAGPLPRMRFSQIFRAQAGVPGDASQDSAAQLLAIMEGKFVVGPPFTNEESVGAALALDVPADAFQRGQHPPGLSRRPVAH